MKSTIKYFFECFIPITVCNFRCHYCYVVQRGNNTMKMPNMKYQPEVIVDALRKERIGGTAYFSICGAGETLMVKELPQIVNGLLTEGHFVNLTTNGTFTRGIDEILQGDRNNLRHLQFAFSLHYLELLRTNKLNVFFDNISKVKMAGCSFLVQINLCDEYIPYIDEIKNICIERVGALPQVAATRKENNLRDGDIELYTNLTKEEYTNIGRLFDSPLFDFTMKNFNVKQKQYCLSGFLGGVLNMETGIYRPCYSSPIFQNLFEKRDEPIRYVPVGRHCGSAFCMNSSHFIALGCIPSYNAPTYVELRNRRCVDGSEWYNEEMKAVLSQKLYKNHKELSTKERRKSDFYFYFYIVYGFILKAWNKIFKILGLR